MCVDPEAFEFPRKADLVSAEIAVGRTLELKSVTVSANVPGLHRDQPLLVRYTHVHLMCI